MLNTWYTASFTPFDAWNRGELLSGTATAISSGAYATEGTTAGPWTGVIAENPSTSNQWSSTATYATTASGYIGQVFATPHQVKEVWVRVNRWSSVLRFRAGDSLSDLKEIRTVSLLSAFEDDYGIPFSSKRPTSTLSRLAPDGFNKFKLPDYTAAKYFVIEAPVYGGGIAADGVQSANSRLGMFQAKLYGF